MEVDVLYLPFKISVRIVNCSRRTLTGFSSLSFLFFLLFFFSSTSSLSRGVRRPGNSGTQVVFPAVFGISAV